MAPISPGNLSGPPRKSKKPTATTKAHRFEGFGKRIAKIKIDPVHTVQKARISEDHSDLVTSFFRSALDEWAELNLTATFTRFLNKVQPLSESLPQILHHADTIFSLLHEHIAKQDVLALEPLLSLVAHLAHDLGSAFEKHFSSTVQLVLRVASGVDDPAAIEHCFTCLAWMFKYLSRSLTQDLRPLLEIVVPYFASKRDYIRRFSAESLAFLLRKAAGMFSKKTKPLELAISYLFAQLDSKTCAELEAFQTALMTLLSESAMGVDAQLHPSAGDLFRCVFDVAVKTESDQAQMLPVLDGTVVYLIHQTTASGFRPLCQLITTMNGDSGNTSASRERTMTSLLLMVTATRRGSRISDWKAVIQALLTRFKAFSEPNNRYGVPLTTLLTISALVLQYCPLDQLLPYANEVLDIIVSNSTPSQFFAFCEISAELGTQRFQDLLFPRLQRYIVSHWREDEDGTIYSMQQLHQKHVISPERGEVGYLACPGEWEQHIVRILPESFDREGFPEEYAKYFRLHTFVHFPKDKALCQMLRLRVASSLNTVLGQQHVQFELSRRLSLGWAFNLYVFLSQKASQQERHGVLSDMFKCRPECYQLLPFLTSCLDMLKLTDTASVKFDYEPMELALCDNMLSESVELRELSLEILSSLGAIRRNDWLTETCALLLELIRVPYNPSNARQIAMLVRRLPRSQELCDHPSSPSLHKLVPHFALGLLRHYFDDTRKEVCLALGRMVAVGKTEDLVLDIATQWLHKPGIPQYQGELHPQDDRPKKLTPFQCSNYQAVQKLSEDAFERYLDVHNILKQEFEQAHSLRLATTPVESRILALQVLLTIPEVAEKRSRALSPVFLSIQQNMANHHVPHSDESGSSHTLSQDLTDQPWSLKERKLFLELTGNFVNPRVLYRAREIYSHLLELLTNGNPDIRRLALLALLNWKDSSLLQYRDALIRVAEEKNANTELASLLASAEETGSVKSHDRASVLPVLLRLIFGQLVGRAGTHGSQEAKRKSILRLLFRMDPTEINIFLGIILGRLGEVSFRHHESNIPGNTLDRDVISQDQQYGFLRMILSIQDILQSQFGPYGKKVIDAIVYCTARACRQANLTLIDGSDTAPASAIVRNIRRVGLQCMTATFEHCEDVEWDHYMDVVFREVVNPRVPNLASELTQGISALLSLFSTWSKSSKLVHILQYNNALTQQLWNILSVPTAQDNVKTFILENVLTPLLEFSQEDGVGNSVATSIVGSDINALLTGLACLLQRQPPRELLLAVTKVIPLLAPFSLSSNSANDVLNLLITLICEPSQRIPPLVKGQLLSAIDSLLRSRQEQIAQVTQVRLYDVVSGLFNYFKDQPNRVVLGKLLSTLADDNMDLAVAVQICQDLNALSTQVLGEIDYEKYLDACNTLNDLPVPERSQRQWLPILQNLLFFARTAEDFAIRSNAVNCLKRFIVEASKSEGLDAHNSLRNVLLPAFKKGVKEKSEVVRADFVAMFGMIVKHLPNAPDLEDMKVLLVGDDEEASFFANILHIQQHRRLRAIRRLLTEVERGVIKPANITDFFLPLLEVFVDDEVEDEAALGTKGQSIAAMSALLKWIDWQSFRTIFRQYRSNLDKATRPEKDAIKLLNNAADALTSALSASSECDMELEAAPTLKLTLPAQDKISEELKSNFIPKLSKFIHHKDEAEISLRIPAARVAAKLIRLLPTSEISLLVSPIILDISQILRSRTQESRDVARNTLAEIVLLLGSSSVQFVLKEMRTTLTRGYQLHVLSYTLHTILLQSAEKRKPGDLDYCLEDLVSVIIDDIFGIVGQEKENQDYISSMKEVKSSKSQDSMELLARSASLKHMSKLLHPFQSLLAGSLTSKQVRQVDELLRRIGVGISHNPAASSRDLLVFAYELIQDFYYQKAKVTAPVLTTDDKNRDRFLIKLRSAQETTSSRSSSMQYKIVRFALDIVRSTLAKNADLLTPENVHGFLPIINDALVEAQDDVRTSAFRLLSTVVKLPLNELDQNSTLYVMEAVKVVKNSLNTSEESSQAAIKLVTAILRERKDVEVRESDVAYLLQRTMPDVEEPDRQGIIFNFIKAVMARRYQLPEVYELLDKIAAMMVTNQTRSARDMARGVFVHFLLDYPQSPNRWTKQLRFLLKNLEYETREGRQSVMEAIHMLLQKLRDEALQDVISTFFIALVLRIANDDDSGCREMAGALLAQLFRTADRSQLDSLLDPLKAWLDQTESLSLLKTSYQAWGVYFDAVSIKAKAEVPLVRESIDQALKISNVDDSDWETHFQALELFSKLASMFPTEALTQGQATIWTAIHRLLSSPHAWIQISAANLVNIFFQDCTGVDNGRKRALGGSCGLWFDELTVVGLLRSSVKVMKYNEGNLELAQKTMQNLAFLGRHVETVGLTCKVRATTDADKAESRSDSDAGSGSDSYEASDSEKGAMKSIPAIQYLLDQFTMILRREPTKLSTASFTPRISVLSLLNNLIPDLSSDSLSDSTVIPLLTTLTYITDPSLQPPRSSDATFADTYQSYVESAQTLQEAVQRRLGDARYVKLMTAVSKIVRDRRGERRTKRKIDRVAQPERAERDKMRRKEMKARRKKGVIEIRRKGRRRDLGF